MACGVFREFCINPGFCETESEWGDTACAQCEAARVAGGDPHREGTTDLELRSVQEAKNGRISQSAE